MKPFRANFLNAIILIAMGLWGYFSSDSPSNTALIPVAFGLLFAVVTPPFRNGNKVVAHVVVLLTFLLIIALIMPLMGSLSRSDYPGIIRVSIMMLSCAFAMTIFIKSFIDARKAKES